MRECLPKPSTGEAEGLVGDSRQLCLLLGKAVKGILQDHSAGYGCAASLFAVYPLQNCIAPLSVPFFVNTATMIHAQSLLTVSITDKEYKVIRRLGCHSAHHVVTPRTLVNFVFLGNSFHNCEFQCLVLCMIRG